MPGDLARHHHVYQYLRLPEYIPPSIPFAEQTNVSQHTVEKTKGSKHQQYVLLIFTFLFLLVDLLPTQVGGVSSPTVSRDEVEGAVINPVSPARTQSLPPTAITSRLPNSHWALGNDSNNGEPLRGTIFKVNLESIEKYTKRLQSIIWDIGASQGTIASSQRKSQESSRKGPQRPNSESLFSSPSTWWYRLREKINPTSKEPSVKTLELLSPSSELTPRKPSTFEESPVMPPNPNPCDISDHPTAASEGCTASRMESFNSEGIASSMQRGEIDQERLSMVSGGDSQYSGIPSSLPAGSDYSPSPTFSSSKSLQQSGPKTQASKPKPFFSLRSVGDISHDPAIYSRPVIAAPTFVFVSLQEVTCHNRPIEGYHRLWELLDIKNKAIESLGTSYHTIHDKSPFQHISSSRIPSEPESTLAMRESGIPDLDFGHERTSSGFRNSKSRSRVSIPPDLNAYEISLFLTCLQLPETLPITRQDGHRMVDRKYQWDSNASKHVSTITRKKHIFHFSLGLWGMCLIGKPQAPSPRSQRFLKNLFGLFPIFGTAGTSGILSSIAHDSLTPRPFKFHSTAVSNKREDCSSINVKHWHCSLDQGQNYLYRYL